MINVIDVKQIDTTKQWVYITVDIDGVTYEHTTVQPWNTKDTVLVGQDLIDWCQSREDIYKLEILKGMYSGAKPKGSTIADMQTWIKDGAENEEYDIETKEKKKIKIEKLGWTNRHPKRIALRQIINDANSIKDIKNILLEII